MAQQEESEPQEATRFRVGDRVVDGWGNEVSEDEEAESDDEDADSSPKSYEDMSGRELKAEIDRRNQDREDEEKITLADNKKSTAVAALKADDEANGE